MIEKIKLKAGRTIESKETEIKVKPITVFVGPNNSGKSQILREIWSTIHSGRIEASNLLLDAIEFREVSIEDATDLADKVSRPARPHESHQEGQVYLRSKYEQSLVNFDHLRNVISNPNSNLSHFLSYYLRNRSVMLDGSGRMGLINDQPIGDLQHEPTSSFQVLFRDDSRRQEVRRIITDAFGSYFVLDPTGQGSLRIRLASRPPINVTEERGIHEEAIAFHASAPLIHQFSDGVKAFTGIIIEAMAGDPEVILMDEPEAFLHPSLAFKLGRELASAALSSGKKIFVSTHSPQFVLGCLQSGAPVDIVRLTYRNNNATARLLPADEILELMRHPLLRSTGVMTGLFYEYVVVTESDADRAFYQEVNERLLMFKPDWGIPNCLFINAQNKQTIHTILKPLRQLGIPAVGIVDVDVVKEGGKVWSSLLRSAGVPEITEQSLSNVRQNIKKALDSTGLDMKRDGGISILNGDELAASQDLLTHLASYGIFIVPGGELESWLTNLKATGHGPTWLINVFESMGEDPSSPTYVRPSESDVWLFLSRTREWLLNPLRKGIPG